ncbi:hypothetical protein [Lysobacter gummosus]
MTQPAYEFVPATDADLPRLLPVLHDFTKPSTCPGTNRRCGARWRR